MRTLALLVPLLAACARYVPEPVDLEAAPRSYAARSTERAGFGAVLDSVGALRGAPASARDAGSLAWATWLIHPERARLLAEVRAAEAGVVRAGGRVAPGAVAEVERSFSGRDGSSPWALGLSGLFRLELGGKRGARIARAEAAVLSARAREEVAALRQVGRVLEALAAREAAGLRAGALADLLEREGRVLARFEARERDGVIGAGELARIRGDRDAAEAEFLAARLEASESATRATEAAGLPLPPVPLLTSLGCAGLGPESLDSLSRSALTRRPELVLVLAGYQEAEGEVRIAAAESWPDLELGPGLLYDHGVGKWTIGFGIPSLPLGYRGPLTEAIALRGVEAARVAEAQVALLGEVRAALERCGAAHAAVTELRALEARAAERARLAEAAYQRGETERVTIDMAELERARWSARVAEGVSREALARLALDRATGHHALERSTE